MKGFLVFLLMFGVAPSGWALQWVTNLYAPDELARRGIVIKVSERASGALDCSLTFDREKVGVTSLELFSKCDQGELAMDLQTRELKNADVCEFTLSRELLMHATFKVGLRDSVPGGTFLQAALVDMVEFGKLSPLLQRRQERLKAMGFSKIVEDRIERYSNSRPARGDGLDLKKFTIEGKVRIVPFKKKE